MDGTEDIKISFINYKLIVDGAGNYLLDGTFALANPYP